MFAFVSLKIKNDLQYELSKLPAEISCQSYSIFRLFFIDDILQKLINYINKYVVD